MSMSSPLGGSRWWAPLLASTVPLLVASTGAAIVIGEISNQVSVNTRRLDRLEAEVGPTLSAESVSNARLGEIEVQLKDIDRKVDEHLLQNGHTR